MTDVARPRLLLAEDDRAVRESLVRALDVEGYDVVAVTDGAEALAAIDDAHPDLLLLDVMMPHVGGLTVCRRVRERGDDVPILVLTARQEVPDRVEGLDAGADDYLPKPFDLDELLARIRALLRRRLPPPEADADVLRVADLEVDPGRRQARRAGLDLGLTRTEFDLLEVLTRNVGVVLTRDTLYAEVWGIDFETTSKSLDVHIGYLRRKTEPDGAARLIHTVRGVGYVVRPPEG